MVAPPTPQRLAYWMLGWRLAPEYREWVVADVRSRAWPLLSALPVLVGWLLASVVLSGLTGATLLRLLAPAVGIFVASLLWRRSRREAALRRHGLLPDGEPQPGGIWYDDAAERARRNRVSAGWGCALLFAALLLLALTDPAP